MRTEQPIQVDQNAAHLELPVGVRLFSCFTHTVQPARALSFGQGYCGVGGTMPWHQRRGTLQFGDLKQRPRSLEDSGLRMGID